MALPGLTANDIDVQVEQGAVIVKGAYPHTDENQRAMLVQEFGHGSFERTCALPHTVDPEQGRASFKDGVLVLTFPIQEAASRVAL